MASNKIQILSIVALACVMAQLCSAGDYRVGGLSDEKAATDEIRNLVHKMHSDIEQKAAKDIETINPLSYSTQVVAGTNYFIKAEIIEKNGHKSHAHIRIYKHFRGDPQVTALKTVGEGEPLRYFQ